MTMREKIEAVMQVQDYENDIKDKLEIIIRHTYDPDIDDVIEFTVDGGMLDVRYTYIFNCELFRRRVDVPVAWLSEDFDYKAAYKEMKRKEAEEAEKKLKTERKRKAAAKRRAAVKKANKEFETYLKLNKKYEKNKAK